MFRSAERSAAGWGTGDLRQLWSWRMADGGPLHETESTGEFHAVSQSWRLERALSSAALAQRSRDDVKEWVSQLTLRKMKFSNSSSDRTCSSQVLYAGSCASLSAARAHRLYGDEATHRVVQDLDVASLLREIFARRHVLAEHVVVHGLRPARGRARITRAAALAHNFAISSSRDKKNSAGPRLRRPSSIVTTPASPTCRWSAAGQLQRQLFCGEKCGNSGV